MTENYDDDTQEIARSTMIGDLVQAVIDEMKAAPTVWQKMDEISQQDVIDRVRRRVAYNVTQAIHIIASDERPTIVANLEQITVKNGVKAVMQLSKKDPSFHDLADATGEDLLIVLPHVEQYTGQEVSIEADPDQPPLLDDMEPGSGGYSTEDPLLPEAIRIVTSNQKVSISMVQRWLKIGYNRAANLVEAMESEGVVTAAGTGGQRSVIAVDSVGGRD